MDNNKKVHPVFTILEHNKGRGQEEVFAIDGESYFERSVREYTAALLSNGIIYESREVLVGEAIKTALEVERQLKLLTEIKKG